MSVFLLFVLLKLKVENFCFGFIRAIGTAAFTGKHRWMFSDASFGEWNPSMFEVLVCFPCF